MLALAAFMDEVDAVAVHVGAEVREAVDGRLLLAPIVTIEPVLGEGA
jgi:hypothetical protein